MAHVSVIDLQQAVHQELVGSHSFYSPAKDRYERMFHKGSHNRDIIITYSNGHIYGGDRRIGGQEEFVKIADHPSAQAAIRTLLRSLNV